MNKSILSLAVAALATLAAGSSSAYSIFSGVDDNGPTQPLTTAAITNSTAAENTFKSKLIGVTTEDFESQQIGAGAVTPLSLSFGVAGNAIMSAGSGSVLNIPAGSISGGGRYSVPGGSQYFSTDAGGTSPFTVNFDQDVAAFGFYGIDIGDFDGTVKLEVTSIGGTVQMLDVPSSQSSVANASVIYFGIIAQGSGELFRSVRFVTSTGNGDTFGFDSFVVGSMSQVIVPPITVPEPASLALIGIAMVGLGLSSRRRA